MKPNLSFITAPVLAAGLAIFLAGCATTGVYRLEQTRNDIDASMARFRNELAFGGINPSYKPQVDAAYAAYQAAFDQALRQAGNNADAPTPANVKQLADELLLELSSIPVVP